MLRVHYRDNRGGLYMVDTQNELFKDKWIVADT